MTATKRSLVYVCLFLILPIAIIGCAISQPILTHNRPSTMSVEPNRLREHVRVLSQQFHPRSFDQPENLAACAAYIRKQFAETGSVPTNQPYGVMRRTYENIIQTFPGQSPARVVVGAHYDSCDQTPGADDNASGVAGLIELAHLLAQVKLQHTVELVAYCTEEPPFFASPHMGSAHHAAWLREEGVDVRAMLALEMIGFFSDERGSQAYPMALLRLLYPSRGNYIAVIGNTGQRRLIRRVKRAMRGATDLPVHSAAVPMFVPGVGFSDHRNYWDQGYPAVMVTDTAFYRNPFYHEAEDTADRLDYDRMADVVVGVFEAVVELAGPVRTPGERQP